MPLVTVYFIFEVIEMHRLFHVAIIFRFLLLLAVAVLTDFNIGARKHECQIRHVTSFTWASWIEGVCLMQS
jgi:hypothetical protein